MAAFLATLVAGLAVFAFNNLIQPPAAQAGEKAAINWGAASVAGLFAGTMAYAGSALDEHGQALLLLAVLGPFAGAAWEQRVREARVYRPDATRASRRGEAADAPELAMRLFTGWRDERVTARGNS